MAVSNYNLNSNPESNPFWRNNAKFYGIDETISRFTPNIVWAKVRRPIHQVLYGVVGAGKTIILKRLSWPAMEAKPVYLSKDNKFIAFYVDLENLSYLNALFEEKIFGADRRFQQFSLKIASYASVLYLSKVIADHLSATKGMHLLEWDVIRSTFILTSNKVLSAISNKNFKNCDEIKNFVEERERDIWQAVAGPRILESKIIEYADSFPTPEQFARLFSSILLSECKDTKFPCIGFFLDQFESLHEKCQVVFNPFLKRENLKDFFSIVASRPFGMSLELPDGFLQPGEDFQITVMEYFPDDFPQYRNLLINACQQILPRNITIEKILDYGKRDLSPNEKEETQFVGFDGFCQFSSRSVRKFFDLCRDAVDLTSGDWRIGIPRAAQTEAIKRNSRMVRDRIKGISGIIQGTAWKLLLSIYQKVNGNTASNLRLPYVIKINFPDLLGMEGISSYGEALLKAAFEEGCVQFVSRSDVSATSLPSHFMVPPIISPILKANIDRNLSISIGRNEIDAIARPPRIGQKTVETLIPPLEKVDSVFLALSFEDVPEPEKTRELFEQIFHEKEIKVVEGSALGLGMISQLFTQIKNTNLTILELSCLRPNVILEMGLSLGIGHRIIAIHHPKAKADLPLWPFLSDMAKIPYPLDKNGVKKVRDIVIKRSKEPINPAHMLKKSLDNSQKLWLPKKRNSFCMYYPESRSTFWTNYIDKIRKIAAEKDYKTYFSSENPLGLLRIENLVRCITRSARIVIATSEEKGMDLCGAFGLGFAFALSSEGIKGRVVRIEEKGKEFLSALSMWPSDSAYYKVWSGQNELFSYLENFLQRERRKRGNKR